MVDIWHQPGSSHWHSHTNWHRCLPSIWCWGLCWCLCSSWGMLCQNSLGNWCIWDTTCWLCLAGPDSLVKCMSGLWSHQLYWFCQWLGKARWRMFHWLLWLLWWVPQWWWCNQCTEMLSMLGNYLAWSVRYMPGCHWDWQSVSNWSTRHRNQQHWSGWNWLNWLFMCFVFCWLLKIWTRNHQKSRVWRWECNWLVRDLVDFWQIGLWQHRKWWSWWHWLTVCGKIVDMWLICCSIDK